MFGLRWREHVNVNKVGDSFLIFGLLGWGAGVELLSVTEISARAGKRKPDCYPLIGKDNSPIVFGFYDRKV